jgi:hypothetical protein
VIDGAGRMDGHLDGIAAAVETLPDGVELAILLAKDGVEEVLPSTRLTSDVRQKAVRRIRRLSVAGGQDNQAALNRAVELATAGAGGVIAWIHGPQPVSLDQSEKLSQHRLWQGAAMPALHDLQTEPGPNRAAEQPQFRGFLHGVPRIDSVEDDLRRLFAGWRPGAANLTYERKRLDTPPTSAPATISGSSHLVRLWADDAILAKARQHDRPEAVALAARYQLVTPVSGAVVLENAQQFKQAGLEPVPEATVPTIPEPSTGLLLILGGGALLLRQRQRRS